MKVVAVNGSPRKTWNTATLLNKALEGAVFRSDRNAVCERHDAVRRLYEVCDDPV